MHVRAPFISPVALSRGRKRVVCRGGVCVCVCVLLRGGAVDHSHQGDACCCSCQSGFPQPVLGIVGSARVGNGHPTGHQAGPGGQRLQEGMTGSRRVR